MKISLFILYKYFKIYTKNQYIFYTVFFFEGVMLITYCYILVFIKILLYNFFNFHCSRDLIFVGFVFLVYDIPKKHSRYPHCPIPLQNFVRRYRHKKQIIGKATATG